MQHRESVDPDPKHNPIFPINQLQHPTIKIMFSRYKRTASAHEGMVCRVLVDVLPCATFHADVDEVEVCEAVLMLNLPSLQESDTT